MPNDRTAGYELLRTAALAEFEGVEAEVGDLAPEGSMRAVVQLDPDDVEWAGLGFMFAVLVLSFGDARPAGGSELDYSGEADEFGVADLIEHFRFENGRLHVYIDYLRGRLVKTDVAVSQDGRVEIQTVNRGQSLGRWLGLLHGRRHVVVVEGGDDGAEE